MEKVFVPREDYNVTSSFLMNLLTAEYSESGSTRRLQKTAIMGFLNGYVEEREDSFSESTNSVGSVKEICQFLTGKTTLPFLPAEKNSFGITVKFIDCSNDHQICFPTVSTCALWLQLLVTRMTTFNDFKYNMDTAISNEKTFGRA